MRTITAEQRRARLASRHRLLAPRRAATPVEAAQSVVALHATDPASAVLAAAQRSRTPDVGAVERALYEDRSLVRMLGMRRTMFVVPAELAPVVQESSTRAVAAVERRKLIGHLIDAGITDDPATWLAQLEDATVAALTRRGQATAAELAEDVPLLRTSMLMARGKPYESRQNVSTRVLFLLAADGRIVRGRPRGSWISSQYRWSPWDGWLPRAPRAWTAAGAKVELVRRWLAAFGPGTVADLGWWTGWPARDVKAALTAICPEEVDLGGVTGLVLPGDADGDPGGAGEDGWGDGTVTLLPALDPTPMGWKGREWFLGEHAPALYDRSGNIGPTVWCDGRIIGGWGHRRDGAVAARLLEDVGSDIAAAADAAAERLSAWLGTVRIMPRFRTPLERELAGA